ncbi:aminotransferase class I/II-fold pyridoxal phosphate-dependent enzyme [Caulobacter sp. CCUG 60055]|uniref:aminotransferase class I/II-fold pyridoxal phosphate-dependent enzyme n=1 Tax=Caulobacter sp. CCUG 60055 TaxID=2100090 RepID=UPI001FA6D6DA|nr:aminotransferase class I/II-fold pyridoxal phosphate-dependent enzyme [Caulobacter sp. CCUG 60055]
MDGANVLQLASFALSAVPQCKPEDGLFAAAERILAGGIGLCWVVDDGGVLVGEIPMSAIRDAVKSGAYLQPLRAADIMHRPARVRANGQFSDRGPIASVDIDGRLIGMQANPLGNFLPVAEPDLSGAEFRNLMDAFLSTWISSTGDYIREFERHFAAWNGMAEGVAVSNGTVSLHLALAALGIGPGDEVIVPDLTFAATINTVIHVGATPVIIDVDPTTWCMSAEGFEQAITSKTRAVIPVHVFGRPAPMSEIAAVARRHGVYIIEDCAEAHGAQYDGKKVGKYSDVASFSFFANKIMTTGEGGICLTNSPEFAERLRMLRDHGMRPDRRYWHEEAGFNFRMTNMQAAIGCAQLERIHTFLNDRSSVMALYEEAFAGILGVRLPPALPSKCEPVTWFACVTVPAEKRSALIGACKDKAIDIRPFFNGLSAMPAYRKYARPCPVSYELSKTGINLPTSNKVTPGVVSVIAAVFREVLAG